MVRFDSNPTQNYNSSQFTIKIEKNIKNSSALSNKINSLDEDIRLNPSYILISNSGISNVGSSKLNGTANTKTYVKYLLSVLRNFSVISGF